MSTKAKRKQITHVNPSETHCNTKSIVVPFRVTYKQWKKLLQKAGGRGNLSHFIRQKLGLKD